MFTIIGGPARDLQDLRRHLRLPTRLHGQGHRRVHRRWRGDDDHGRGLRHPRLHRHREAQCLQGFGFIYIIIIIYILYILYIYIMYIFCVH